MPHVPIVPDLTPKPIDLAYLAGMIDGDGYISITRNQRLYFAPQIGIAGTRREPHELAASFWGGKISTYAPKLAGHRAQFQWSRVGAVAALAIEAVQPFLRVKAEQAELALALWHQVEEGNFSKDDPYPWLPADYDPIARREAMRAEMVDLNQSRRRLRLLDNITHDAMPKPSDHVITGPGGRAVGE